MAHKNIPIRLVSLQIHPYSGDTLIAHQFPGQSYFDNRSDFVITPSQKALAMLLRFSNQKMLSNLATPGIRRKVALTLYDVDADTTLIIQFLTVNFKRGEAVSYKRVDFEFEYAHIDCSHTYRVRVSDTVTGQILGQRDFHVFDEQKLGRPLAESFAPLTGTMLQFDNKTPYKAFHAVGSNYFKLYFMLRSRFERMPHKMPELEIRAYYPNGAVDTRFATPEATDADGETLEVCACFFADHDRLGIGYAELRCMNKVLAGFLFSTDSEERKGLWTDTELQFFKGLVPEVIVNQIKETADGDAKPLSGGEMFDKMLDEICDGIRADHRNDFNDPDDSDDSLDFNDSDGPLDFNDSLDSDDFDDSAAAPSPEYNLLSLDQMIGLEGVKTKMVSLENFVKFNQMRMNHHLACTLQPLHAMFLGSPGTGKTTVAKNMGRMLKAAGVLSKGHVVERQRATLLGPNYSNEETNTLEAIEKAQGGILFIDEAYQLYQADDPRDPGRFVIETLLTALSDESRRDWMLILAGYPDEMRRMFDMNPGFRSRIPEANVYVFDDFSEKELMQIAENYFERNDFSLSTEAHEALTRLFAADYQHRDKKFGNGRYVINAIQTEILPHMANRVAKEVFPGLEALTVIQACDIPAPKDYSSAATRRIGFHL